MGAGDYKPISVTVCGPRSESGTGARGWDIRVPSDPTPHHRCVNPKNLCIETALDELPFPCIPIPCYMQQKVASPAFVHISVVGPGRSLGAMCVASVWSVVTS